MVTLLLAATLVTQAPPPQQTPPTPPAETKTDAKATTLTAAGMAGKWTLTVQTGSGASDSTIDLKADPKDAKKFTGTISSQMGTANLTGEVVDGKFTFTFPFTGSGGEVMLLFSGTQQKDGSLAGMLNFGQGEIAFTAVKAK